MLYLSLSNNVGCRLEFGLGVGGGAGRWEIVWIEGGELFANGKFCSAVYVSELHMMQ